MKLFDISTFELQTQIAKNVAYKLSQKTAKIGVIGLGYVGLPLALEFAKNGFDTFGIDVSTQKVSLLNQGKNYIEDLSDEEVKTVVENKKLSAYNDFSKVKELDVVYICVPTPFTPTKDPDLSYILSATESIRKYLQQGQVIILKSTTFPGTTENYVVPELEKSGLKAGKDFFVAFSPERVDPGNKQFNTRNTPIIVGGINEESSYLAALANSQVIEKVYIVSNPKVAEMEKLLENIFRSVNIALVNELALLCERMYDINVWEVLEAAGTKPFGYMKFLPGPGVGGHCIPIDPYYLSWLARSYDFETRFVTLAANVNESMPYYVVDKAIREIAKQGVKLSQAKILILGASFKKNVRDLRHSPSEYIIRILKRAGAEHIDYNDPHTPEYEVDNVLMQSVTLSPEQLQQYDIVILVTDHDDYDYEFILKHIKCCFLDTRNGTKNVTQYREKIILLGYVQK
ncbi:MAG: nucleotide sugar dehydrogenase [Bacteroidia bacterium]|nr:nucleotide sugar dehydrogenase [Bacteroidia bacterium]MDW8301112.1 nucleotide sugar dehydrogenase [Bacteroidia bacterium]